MNQKYVIVVLQYIILLVTKDEFSKGEGWMEHTNEEIWLSDDYKNIWYAGEGLCLVSKLH